MARRNGITLYHGTLRALVPSIMRDGLTPRVGALVREAYSDSGETLHPIVFAADEEGLRGVISALMTQIGYEYGKPFNAVSSADIEKHGALAIIHHAKESPRDWQHWSEDDYDDGDHPVQVEQGDWYSYFSQPVDEVLTGKKLVRFLREAGAVRNPMRSNEIKLSETALSVFETDVYELAEDPESFGLDEDETTAYQALAACVDLDRAVLVIPESAQERRLVADLLTDLANGYDDALEHQRDQWGPEELRFAVTARRVMTSLASKVRAWAALRPGDRVVVVRPISRTERELLGREFVLDRFAKPHGYAVVSDEWGAWHVHPEALDLV